jgi:hypothetical protein
MICLLLRFVFLAWPFEDLKTLVRKQTTNHRDTETQRHRDTETQREQDQKYLAGLKVSYHWRKASGMNRMPLGLSQGIVTLTLGQSSGTTGIKPVACVTAFPATHCICYDGSFIMVQDWIGSFQVA